VSVRAQHPLVAVTCLLLGCGDEPTATEDAPSLPPIVPSSSCVGTWRVDTPVRGEASCPFADPHALSFTIEGDDLAHATRSNGERVELELAVQDSACRATVRFDDRFSADFGSVTLALRDDGGRIEGELRRKCSTDGTVVSGRRTSEVHPTPDPLPPSRLRRAYATLLEQCTFEHDMRSAATSRVDFVVSPQGRLLELGKDGHAIDLDAACPAEARPHAIDGFLGRPGETLRRSLLLSHRVPDALGVGPLVLGVHTSALPRLGLRQGPQVQGSVRFEQDGQPRPATIGFGEHWTLHDERGELVCEAHDDPGDRRVDRLRTPVLEVPGMFPLDTFLALGPTRQEVVGALEGWMVHDTPSSRAPLQALSPCSFELDGERVAFAGRDPIYWDDGGFVRDDEMFLCRSDLLFHVTPADVRVYERQHADRWAFASPMLWYRDRGSCTVALDVRLEVDCEHNRSYRPEFRGEGAALLWINGTFDPPIDTRAVRVNATTPCERALERHWQAFEPWAYLYVLPEGDAARQAYRHTPRAREWVAECERLPPAAQRCIESAPEIEDAHETCEKAPQPPAVAWNLDKREVGPELAPPTAAEARAIFDRLVGTWGDPDRRYSFDARFYRRAGKMWMDNGGRQYEVTFEEPRTIRVEAPAITSFRRFAFVDDDHLYLNDDAIAPLPSREAFLTRVTGAYLMQDGRCLALHASGVATPRSCTFERDAEGIEHLVVVDPADPGHVDRVAVVDGMLVHPDIDPLERAE
jgi:hypothetical protein